MKTLVLLLLSFSTTTAFAAYGLGLGQAPKYPAGFRAYGYVYSGRQGWVLKTEADAIKLDTLFKRFVYRPSAAKKPRRTAFARHTRQPHKGKTMSKKIKVGIVGATGYTAWNCCACLPPIPMSKSPP